MDPFGLMLFTAIVWAVKEKWRDARAGTAVRASRIDAWRDTPASSAGSAPRAAARANRTFAPRGTAPSESPAAARPRVHSAPSGAHRLGSRLAAALFTYPALAWMVPAGFARGCRYGRLIGRHYRRHGDVDTARRDAAADAAGRGWKVPDWVTPDAAPRTAGPRTTRPGTRTARPAAGPNAAPPVSPPAAETPPSATVTVVRDATTRTVRAEDIVDIEIVPDAPTAPGTTAPPEKGTTTMSDITPAGHAAAAATFEAGDYDAIQSLGRHGQRVAAGLGEAAEDAARLLARYAAAVENVHAEAASMRVDPATQGDIAEFQAMLGEASEFQRRLAEFAEALGDQARLIGRNLLARHGGIKEAVEDAPVTHAAESAFYGKARAA